MALGRFIKMVEGMLGAGKFQIAGESEVYESKAEVDAVLFERGYRMEAVWYPAADVKDAPEWATKVFYFRTIANHVRVGKNAFVFAE